MLLIPSSSSSSCTTPMPKSGKRSSSISRFSSPFSMGIWISRNCRVLWRALKAYECELSRDSDQRITSHVVSFAKIAFPVLNISLFIKSSVIIQTRVWTRQEGKDCVRTNDFMFYVTIVRIISECDFFFFKPTCLVFRKPKIVYRNANYWWRNYLAK